MKRLLLLPIMSLCLMATANNAQDSEGIYSSMGKGILRGALAPVEGVTRSAKFIAEQVDNAVKYFQDSKVQDYLKNMTLKERQVFQLGQLFGSAGVIGLLWHVLEAEFAVHMNIDRARMLAKLASVAASVMATIPLLDTPIQTITKDLPAPEKK